MASGSTPEEQGAPAEDLNHQVVVIDNGAYTIKGGFAGHDDPQSVLPNCTAKSRRSARVHVADQCENYSATGDFSQLHYSRPFERGYLNDWEAQTQVWDHLFSEKYLDIDPKDNSLMVTEPVLNPRRLREQMNEVVFESYEFQSFYCATGPRLAGNFYALEHPQSAFNKSYCRLIVDSGYSFSHVIPVFDGFNIDAGIKRVDIGGKALTNYFKQIVSYRQFNVMDETYVMNQAKETVAHVSLNYSADLERFCRMGENAPLAVEYILPDFKTVHEGFVRENPAAEATNHNADGGNPESERDAETDSPPAAKRPRRGTRRSTRGAPVEEAADDGVEEPQTEDTQSFDGQSMPVRTERISVPELLFRPGNGGIAQGGVVDAIVQSLDACHSDLRAPLLSNILVVGGNACLPNFCKRLEAQLREVVPDHVPINVSVPADPVLCTWRGAYSMASSSEFGEHAVTKAEYEEHGHSICNRRFHR